MAANTEIQGIAQHRRETVQNSSWAFSELQACLALVRPVGMSEDAATEWLTVAFGELRDFAELRPTGFESACKKARQECTHHGKIVPFILSKRLYEWESEKDWNKMVSQKNPAPLLSESAEVTKLITDTGRGLKRTR